ncbi:MAG: phospholipase D-like domain-containing protein [Vicinamibacteria bacterium]
MGQILAEKLSSGVEVQVLYRPGGKPHHAPSLIPQAAALGRGADILDDSLAEAMKTAALAGIDVRLMIAPRGAEGSLAYRAGMTYAVDMARAGVRVLLYQGAYFHPKTVSIDSAVCSIGSANMDIRSFAIDYETNLVIYDEEAARELERDFEEDQRHCVPFSVSVYEARKLPRRFADSVMRLCSPLL